MYICPNILLRSYCRHDLPPKWGGGGISPWLPPKNKIDYYNGAPTVACNHNETESPLSAQQIKRRGLERPRIRIIIVNTHCSALEPSIHTRTQSLHKTASVMSIVGFRDLESREIRESGPLQCHFRSPRACMLYSGSGHPKRPPHGK